MSEGIPDTLRDWIVTDKTAGAPPPKTTTAKNARLRAARWEEWRQAEAFVDYWNARLKFMDAVERARKYDLKDACAHPETDPNARWRIVQSYRDALSKHLLTPAPDLAAVTWKRQQLHKSYIDVKKLVLERVIADDIAFLDAHPVRQSRANKSG